MIMDVIDQPQNIGDLHIKLLLSESQNYAVNKTLVEFFLKSFYTVLWDTSNQYLKNRLNLDVLAGEHNESAFVEIKTDMVISYDGNNYLQECLKVNKAPLIWTQLPEDGTQIFINHVDAVTIQRIELSKFFTQHVDH